MHAGRRLRAPAKARVTRKSAQRWLIELPGALEQRRLSHNAKGKVAKLVEQRPDYEIIQGRRVCYGPGIAQVGTTAQDNHEYLYQIGTTEATRGLSHIVYCGWVTAATSHWLVQLNAPTRKTFTAAAAAVTDRDEDDWESIICRRCDPASSIWKDETVLNDWTDMRQNTLF